MKKITRGIVDVKSIIEKMGKDKQQSYAFVNDFLLKEIEKSNMDDDFLKMLSHFIFIILDSDSKLQKIEERLKLLENKLNH